MYRCQLKNRIIDVYDSMWSNTRSVLVEQFVIPHLSALLGIDEVWTVNHHGTSAPQQNNGFDCGIFVIHTIMCIYLGKEVTAPPADFRKTVLGWLVNEHL